MPKRDGFGHATPCWVDVASTDEEAAKDFYGKLFGWTWAGSEMPDGGKYWTAILAGERIAGLTGQTEAMAEQDMPSAWYTYIAVTSVDETTAKAEATGATVIAKPTDVGDSGRMAFVKDPSGAAIGMWEAGEHKGAGLVGEAGALVWNEVYAPDTDATVEFYRRVFAWDTGSVTMPDGSDYTTFEIDGTTIGGTTPPPMDGVSPHWHVWFGSDDVDATAARAADLGATVLVAPTESPNGRFASFRDPTGAAFSVVTPAPAG